MIAEPASPSRGRAGPGARVPRRAAAWAWEAMSTVGVELDGGLVRLPYTQADLSARFGWPRNDGRVAAYLRALGPVVVSRRGGVVLDRHLLASIAPPDDGPGTPDASPAAREPGLYLVSAPRHHQDLGGPSGPGRDELIRRLAALDERLLEVLWEQRSLLRELLERPAAGGASGPAREPAEYPRDEGSRSAEYRGIPRTHNREEKGVSLKVEDQTLTFLPSASDQPRETAASAESADQPPTIDRGWEDAELPVLLGELLAVCRERGFPGLNNPSLAAAALGAYTRAQVLHAQREIVRQVRAGQHFTSPVGVLVNAARNGKVGYFPPASPAPVPVRLAEPEESEVERVDEEAAAAVLELETDPSRAEELALLDDLVRRDLAGAPLGERTMRSPHLARVHRQLAWRRAQAQPGSR